MRLNKKRGFTLIELLVVMAIILILSGLVILIRDFLCEQKGGPHACS